MHRRRFRFEIENHWRFCWSEAEGKIVVGCHGCDSAYSPCADPTHTKLIESGEGTRQLFAPVFKWVDAATSNGHNVLIHCLAGAHRAGTTAIAFLMHTHGIDVWQATRLAKKLRPCIDPLGPFAELLIRLDAGN